MINMHNIIEITEEFIAALDSDETCGTLFIDEGQEGHDPELPYEYAMALRAIAEEYERGALPLDVAVQSARSLAQKN